VFPAAPCTSPWTTGSLADGVHTATITAADQAGNTSTATRTWTIDSTLPQTTMSVRPPATTNLTTAHFEFSSDLAGATFLCKLDTGAEAACTSPHDVSGLTDGTHTFTARAVKPGGGSQDPTPATATWTVDTVAPETRFTSTPETEDGDGNLSFSFTSTESGSTFECSLNGAPVEKCVSPKRYDGLVDGQYLFSVRAIDKAGNGDPSPLTAQVTVKIEIEPGGGDVTAPAEVSNLKVKKVKRKGKWVIVISWKRPPDADFDHVEIERTPAPARKLEAVLFSGKAITFTDRSAKKGKRYTYLVRTVDTTGNKSAGVPITAVGGPPPIVVQPNPAKRGKQISMSWFAVKKAFVYELEILRRGNTVLIQESKKPRLTVLSKLKPAVYTATVRPLFKKKGKEVYGAPIGTETFTVV
jgi:predicted phage tail protein